MSMSMSTSLDLDPHPWPISRFRFHASEIHGSGIVSDAQYSVQSGVTENLSGDGARLYGVHSDCFRTVEGPVVILEQSEARPMRSGSALAMKREYPKSKAINRVMTLT